ncbi:hypothetical protein RS130_04765 [Paraglaciecola aquimarina]|uniref:Uncharacterized protein n=1 Tax=Paraglaciecola aquimarina TaxID=1235557 RepID=A0ABU3STL2_9ALTE|nr:hypothetical protein [Paraglaciecola aquimarina]MDU0353334.1 hypothetical protein [Paraglaciecola aquimarina]
MTQSVLHTLEQNVGLQVTPESKPQLFSAAANGRFITLSANHHSAEILQPVLSTWIAEYLALESAEKVKNNSQNLASSNTQLQSIEQKITAKQRAIELFAKENDITSLERDENRVLNKIKALSANLDQAIAERTAAQSSLNSLLESVNKGQSIIRDIDKEQINKTRQELQLLQSELTALESKYTQVYLARDPVIVAKQQTQLALKQSLAEQLEQSQQYYLQEAERDLSQSIDNVKQTERQFRLENKQAQDFSQRLQAYKVLTTELDAIQQQAQTIRDNLVVQEVSKPFDATITILEQPFTPESPTGPDYWRMTIFSLLASLGCGVFALLLFGYIVKQKQPTNTATNFVVMPGQL